MTHIRPNEQRRQTVKPSSDIDLFTTTLPFPVLVSLILFLRRTLGCSRDPFRRLLGSEPVSTVCAQGDTASLYGPGLVHNFGFRELRTRRSAS